MSLEGMDVDELQGIATQLDTDLQTLNRLVSTVSGLAGRLSAIWRGPAASDFEADWQFKYRPSLLVAASTLTSLHTHLVSNLNQQAAASAADGGSIVVGVVGKLEDGAKIIGTVGLPLSIIGELGEGAPVLGKHASVVQKAWSDVTDDHLVRLPTADVNWVQRTAKFVDDSHIGTGLKVVGLAGTVVGAVHVVKDDYRMGEDLGEGHYVAAANEGAEMVGDGLEAYPSPVTYLAGVDVKLLDQVANLDWKDTPSPFSGNNFQQDYVPALTAEFTTTAGLKEAGKTLWGAM
jgi:uncharacterized protein YukE